MRSMRRDWTFNFLMDFTEGASLAKAIILSAILYYSLLNRGCNQMSCSVMSHVFNSFCTWLCSLIDLYECLVLEART